MLLTILDGNIWHSSI